MTRVTSAPGALLDLHKAAVYLSPAGRPCRWAATHEQAPGQPRVATFLYDLPGGRPAIGLMADGFVLTEGMWHLMRRVA